MKDGQTVIDEEQITKDDIDGYYEVSVKLNPEDDVEDDRDFMKYRMLVNEGRISWKEFLIKGCKMTEWEADDMIAETLAEKAVRDDPIMNAARTQEALEQMGMTRYIKKAQEEQQMQGRMQAGLEQYNAQGGNGGGGYRPTEVRNPMSVQRLRQVLTQGTGGVRKSPQMNAPVQGGKQITPSEAGFGQ
jgi:hypothetical protein